MFERQTVMLSAKVTTFLLVALLMFDDHTDAYRRRRRRRSCTPRDCKVTFWTSWSSCSAEQCGEKGTKRRLRAVVTSSSCGGAKCPALRETRYCYTSRPVTRCLNGGSLEDGKCFCKEGYTGDCCEKGIRNRMKSNRNYW